jgi:hypothetical protein
MEQIGCKVVEEGRGDPVKTIKAIIHLDAREVTAAKS